MHLSRSFFLSTEHGQKSFKFLNMSGLPNSFCKNLLFIINNFFHIFPPAQLPKMWGVYLSSKYLDMQI